MIVGLVWLVEAAVGQIGLPFGVSVLGFLDVGYACWGLLCLCVPNVLNDLPLRLCLVVVLL